MNNIILFDDDVRDNLLPITYTRPVCEIRLGILTIKEKWEKWLNGTASYITQDYLSQKFPINITDQNFVINGSVLPNEHLVRLITQLDENEALLDDGILIATKLNAAQFNNLINDDDIQELKGFELGETPFHKINQLWDIFTLNGEAIKADFQLLTAKRRTAKFPSSNWMLAKENIFIEEGAIVECSSLNAKEGPIYIGKNAEVMEGSHIRGPFALCDNGLVKMGSKIYGATTVGPFCKVGGEVKNVVFFGYSSKGHDGYLGNSVVGEWCNFGADTNSSNMKNNYSEVKLWDYPSERFKNTGLSFCGMVMGDHSKCGINTMFNTGTVVGVFANVFGDGFLRNFIPSFSWGGPHGYTTYRTAKAFQTAEISMGRKKVDLTEQDKAILQNVFNQSTKFRAWEKVEQS